MSPPACNHTTGSTRPDRQAGALKTTSLAETALVLAIVFLVLALGLHSIRHMLHQGRESKTHTRLVQVKDCLLKRAVFNNRFPTYEPGEVDCNDLTYDVNACFCLGNEPAQDAWDTPLVFLEGLSAQDAGLQGGAITNKDALDFDPKNSRITTRAGESIEDVAFVLLSHGPNKRPDDASYALKGPTSFIPGVPPDFSANNNDDLFLPVTATELRKRLAE